MPTIFPFQGRLSREQADTMISSNQVVGLGPIMDVLKAQRQVERAGQRSALEFPDFDLLNSVPHYKKELIDALGKPNRLMRGYESTPGLWIFDHQPSGIRLFLFSDLYKKSPFKGSSLEFKGDASRLREAVGDLLDYFSAVLNQSRQTDIAPPLPAKTSATKYQEAAACPVNNLKAVKEWMFPPDREYTQELADRNHKLLRDNRKYLEAAFGAPHQHWRGEFLFKVWRIPYEDMVFWVASAKAKGTSIEVESDRPTWKTWPKADEQKVIGFLEMLCQKLTAAMNEDQEQKTLTGQKQPELPDSSNEVDAQDDFTLSSTARL